MSESLMERLTQAAKQEVARALEGLCHEVGAAESSVLIPMDDVELVFFASTNQALTQPATPRVPINASYSGIAYRTGQTVAVADAAGKGQHFEAVDELLHSATHEFAAVPLTGRKVIGVLTLVNRAAGAKTGGQAFGIGELRRAQTLASEIARALELLPGLTGIDPHEQEHTEALGQELIADLRHLNNAERRVTHALASALIQNRAE